MAAMATEAGVAAASTAAVGFGLFNYNRANYLYDAEFRYERFTAGREYAVEQQNQYRNDLRTLSALTMVKNNQYAGLAALDMALCIALYCAGRLGLHGPSPPGWIMGLWLTNNAGSFSFMGLAIFLALHASFRAQAASVNLLTRKIRVPVPSMRQLDKARRFSSEFEQQQWSDIFRVPYMANPGVPKTDETSSKVSGSRARPNHRGPTAPLPAMFPPRNAARAVAHVARYGRLQSTLHAANAPSHVAGSDLPFMALKEKPMTHTTHLGRHRAINLAAGAAALPLEVLERAANSFVETDHSGMSVAEMGYRTKPFHRIMERAENSLREFLSIPDSHEVHFFNGGATLQFAAIPLNLLGGVNEGKPANYLMSGHWSEKARNEAQLFGEVKEVAVDPKGLYFEIPDSKTWDMDPNGAYFHYTSADTRQGVLVYNPIKALRVELLLSFDPGLEIRDFDFAAIPPGMPVCCDASANLGSAPIDVSKLLGRDEQIHFTGVSEGMFRLSGGSGQMSNGIITGEIKRSNTFEPACKNGDQSKK
eukprot:s1227_g14.t1